MVEKSETANVRRDCRLSIDLLTRVAAEVRGYTLEESTDLCDEILDRQPLAISCVLALCWRGVSFPMLGHAFFLLMLIYVSFREAGVAVGTITEKVLKTTRANTMAMASFFAGEPCETERERLIELGIAGYPEPHLLIYWITYARDKLLKDGCTVESSLVIGTTKSLLDSFVLASTGRDYARRPWSRAPEE